MVLGDYASPGQSDNLARHIPDNEAKRLLQIVRVDILSGVCCVIDGLPQRNVELITQGFEGSTLTLKYLSQISLSDGYKTAINREFARRLEDLNTLAVGAEPERNSVYVRAHSRAESIFAADRSNPSDPVMQRDR
jgi:hypothetical protein